MVLTHVYHSCRHFQSLMVLFLYFTIDDTLWLLSHEFHELAFAHIDIVTQIPMQSRSVDVTSRLPTFDVSLYLYPDLTTTDIRSKQAKMPSVLIVGATRGLGLELARQYVTKSYTVTGTARSNPAKDAPDNVQWISGVDVAEEAAGRKIAEGLKGQKQDIVIISAGYFGKESFDEPDFEAEVSVTMNTLS